MKERPLVAELADERESAAQRYRRLFVGAASTRALVHYEFVTSLLGPLPGAVGYTLRRRFYPALFDRVGRGTVFGRGITLRSPGRIAVGEHVMLDDYIVLDAKGVGSRIEIGDRVLLGRQTIVSCTDAQVRIGNFVSLGPWCLFACKSHIVIGSNVAVGPGTHFMAGSHESADTNIPIILQTRTATGITVEDNVWVGSGAHILDGVTVGHDSVIGAGAVIGKDVPPWSVVVGNPGRVVESRKAKLSRSASA